jgi:hypothetical protein
MKRSLLLLLPAVAAMLLFSCNKGDNNTLNTTTPGGYASLDDIFNRTAPAATTQSIIVSQGGSILSRGGTRFIIPRDAFQTYSGAIVTGSVDVKVYDWVQKGDMVFGRVLPVSNNEALYSSGEAYIEVTQKGAPVRLRQGYTIQILFPQFGHLAGGDSAYVGRAVAGSSNTVNWYGLDAGGTVGAWSTDTIVLATDSFHYVAASHFLPNSGYHNFSITLNTPVALEQTMAVALFDNLKAVYPVSSAVNNTISAQHIPGGPIHLAVMGVNKGVFYAGIVGISGYPGSPGPGTDSTYQVDIRQVDPQAFRLQMNALL